MPYGILKADTLTYYTATGDVSVAISGIAISGSPLISGVSGIFTTSVSGATVTGNAGQFTTITGGTAQFTNITGVSGTFTSRISGATVTGTSGQFTTLTATTGVFTTSISGATISGDLGLFSTISGSQGFFSSNLSVPSGTAGSPSISFNGDSNTGIYSSATDTVAISTNGTGRLFVNSGGNVSIGPGVTSGARLLHIAETTGEPSIKFTNDTSGHLSTDGFDITFQGANAFLTNRENGYIAVENNGSERMRLDSSGRLGLGTSSPAELLNVNGNIALDTAVLNTPKFLQFRANSDGTGTPSYGGITWYNFQWDATKRAEISSGPDAGAAAAGYLAFSTGITGITERMRISAAGNVGIGTTSPSDLLHVVGAGRFTGTAASLDQNGAFIDYASSVARISAQGTSGGTLSFYTNPNGGFNTERARIDSSGRLLVGTSTASAADATVIVQGNGQSSAFGSRLYLSRGEATPADNAGLGHLNFSDSTHTISAMIRALRDGGTWSASSKPGRIEFSTTADGSSSPTERMRIAQNGVITIQNGAVAVIGTLTDGATITPDFAADCNFAVTLGGSRTMANPTNITAGQSGSIFISQSTGSHTLSWGSYWDFPGGTPPTLSTAAGAVDRIDYVVRTSTSIHTVFTANYS